MNYKAVLIMVPAILVAEFALGTAVALKVLPAPPTFPLSVQPVSVQDTLSVDPLPPYPALFVQSVTTQATLDIEPVVTQSTLEVK